jgi:DNA-binding LacI/PurR family transcriptional regulator
MRPSLKDRGTLTDVAKVVGVSVASVSYAFSRPDQLSPELREKILATARSLNYPGPNPAARMLRTGFAGSIAVVYASPLYLKKKPRPTAILATSDRLTLGVIEVARKYQLSIPKELAVVGFDDIPAAKMSAPQLTTVRQPLEEKGRVAVAALLKEKRPLRTILPTKLIIRQSSDPTVLGADQERELDIQMT